MSNYSLNNVRRFDFLLNEDDYWDTYLNPAIDGAYDFSGIEIDQDCLGSYIDTDIDGCVSGNTLNSVVAWDEACNYGLDLKNIGLTGADNGLIRFKRDRITNTEFYKIYTQSEYKVDDLFLHLHTVSGITGQYEYPTSINDDGTIKLNGGFYQGFFRSGKQYSILPSIAKYDWNLEFMLKKEDYEPESTKTLNDKYPENKGIFFYIGTRAQNKWIYLYQDIMSAITECTTEDEFDLIEEDLYLSDVTFKTSDGMELDSANDAKIESDNKFLFFNRTPWGETASEYSGDTKIILTYKTRQFKDNLYKYVNRTPTGYTASDIDELISGNTQAYSADTFNKDIIENALGFFIDDNGAIGYRYVVRDCSADTEGHYAIDEGKSYDNIIPESEWVKINVKVRSTENYMKLYFYVNNKLKYITKFLPKLNLRELNEIDEKQEGVPFSISIGGGVQGLLETVLPNYMKNPTEEYPLEKNFAGSFIGDFKYFKFYTC